MFFVKPCVIFTPKKAEENIVKYFLCLIIFFFLAAYHTWSDRTISRPPGVLCATEPVQALVGDAAVVRKQDISLTPLASFEVKARVVLRKRYYFGRAADLAPVDLVLAWGPMSDQDNLKYFDFSQSNRFYFWSTKSFPVPRQVVESHTANMHMIPADASIDKLLKSLRPGNIIHLKGYLVEARAADGWHWRSSLSRNDTGAGACEVVLVQSLEAL